MISEGLRHYGRSCSRSSGSTRAGQHCRACALCHSPHLQLLPLLLAGFFLPMRLLLYVSSHLKLQLMVLMC
jgi:hypothetical protein